MKQIQIGLSDFCGHLLFGVTMLFFCVPLSAQELSVKSMEYIPNDASAASYETQMEYDNGLFAGIVKVYVALDGVEFEGGGVLKQEKRGIGEYWVWMAKDSSRLKVRVQGFLPLDVNFRNYEGVNVVHAKSTYKLVLTAAKSEREQTQKLTLRYTPADATVIIDDNVVTGINGVIEIQLPVGDHSYSIVKQGYAIDKGIFTLLSSAPKRLIVELEKLPENTPVIPVTTNNDSVFQIAETVTPPSQGLRDLLPHTDNQSKSTQMDDASRLTDVSTPAENGKAITLKEMITCPLGVLPVECVGENAETIQGRLSAINKNWEVLRNAGGQVHVHNYDKTYAGESMSAYCDFNDFVKVPLRGGLSESNYTFYFKTEKESLMFYQALIGQLENEGAYVSSTKNTSHLKCTVLTCYDFPVQLMQLKATSRYKYQVKVHVNHTPSNPRSKPSL